MKALNITLSILIFVLALASAVFSYFLFEKRTQFIDGWNKLTVAINKVSGELDKKSGTGVAKELTNQTLAHQNYDKLDNLLGKLSSHGRKVTEQRNDLADGMARIAKKGNVAVEEAALCNLKDYKENRDNVVKGIFRAFDTRDSVYDRVEGARQVLDEGSAIDLAELKGGNADAISPLERAIAAAKERRGCYEAAMGKIAGLCGGKVSFGDNYKTGATRTIDAVDRMNKELRITRGDLEAAEEKVRKLQEQLGANSKTISQLEEQARADRNRLDKLAAACNLKDAAQLPVLWEDGSKEVRDRVVGKVVRVSKEYGYIVFDLGTKTRVIQKVGSKQVKIDPQIMRGLQVAVAKGNLKEKATFVARLTLNEVGSDCSVADLPADTPEVSVGDIVYIPAK